MVKGSHNRRAKMPKISQLPFDPSVISLSVERAAPRSSGVHLSHILKDRLITAGIERKTTGKPFTAEQQSMLWQTGFLWERMVTEYIHSYENVCIEWDMFVGQHLKPITDDAIQKSNGDIVRPGECSLDGIHLTPDAINIKGGWVEEWKATGIRAKGFSIPDRKIEWIWQTGAYAKVFGYTKAIIRVWHYSQMPPEVQQFVVEWTTEELDENWRQILQHWKHMKERDGRLAGRNAS